MSVKLQRIETSACCNTGFTLKIHWCSTDISLVVFSCPWVSYDPTVIITAYLRAQLRSNLRKFLPSYTQDTRHLSIYTYITICGNEYVMKIPKLEACEYNVYLMFELLVRYNNNSLCRCPRKSRRYQNLYIYNIHTTSSK